MKYHIKNKNSKKEMKKARSKPIPLILILDESIYNCIICGQINMYRSEAYKHPCKGFRLSLGLE